MTLTILPRLVEGTLEDMEDGFHIRQTKLFKYVVGVRVSVPTSQDKPDPDQTSQDKPDTDQTSQDKPESGSMIFFQNRIRIQTPVLEIFMII